MNNTHVVYIDFSINMLNVQFDFLQKSPRIAQARGSSLQKLGHFFLSQNQKKENIILYLMKIGLFF